MTAFHRTHCLWLVKIAVRWIAVQRYIHSGQRLGHSKTVRAGVWFLIHWCYRWFVFNLHPPKNIKHLMRHCYLGQIGLWNILWKWLFKLTWDSFHMTCPMIILLTLPTQNKTKKQLQPSVIIHEQLSRNFRSLEWNHATVTYC